MLEDALQKYFGHTSFRTGQREVISRIVAHQSAAAIFPTGAGKSLCYQLPAMLLPQMTLVVSPLLALMKDQIDFLLKQGIPAARLDSTLSKEDYDQILEKAKNGKIKILMISVERFKNERFRFHLQRMAVSLLVVDEAHCISEWGHNFRPEYLMLPFYRKDFNIEQVLLLTATATEQVILDMCRKFSVPREHVTITGFYRKNLFLQVTPIKESEKMGKLLQRIREAPHAPTIVYVTLQKTAGGVADFLRAQGINCCPYHAGMATEERERIQNEFLAGSMDCIVATIAFGMGIDKKDIRRVIHYDLPKSIENYSQEIGRSGRDGQPSLCEVLANRDNISILENFIYGDTPEKQSVYLLLEKIHQHKNPIWEIKLTALSYELNIRILPLKTLLVYLDMEGIIRPKYSYFDEYVFKFILESSQIVDQFDGERKEFVKEIFRHSHTKKTWTYVDLSGILQHYAKADRQRVINALEYFSQKGWIDLKAQHAIEAYNIIHRNFNREWVGEKLCNLFHEKEQHEIARIHNMVDFFESTSCLSKRLAKYFGEDIEKEVCGHCSVCRSGNAVIQPTVVKKPLDAYDLKELINGFITVFGTNYSVSDVTKFLCGIPSPVFVKFKVSKVANFGLFERYPFLEVKSWVNEQLKGYPCKHKLP